MHLSTKSWKPKVPGKKTPDQETRDTTPKWVLLHIALLHTQTLVGLELDLETEEKFKNFIIFGIVERPGTANYSEHLLRIYINFNGIKIDSIMVLILYKCTHVYHDGASLTGNVCPQYQ